MMEDFFKCRAVTNILQMCDLYSRRNNTEIHVNPKIVKGEEFESKVIDIFSALNVSSEVEYI